ncbi:probable RNA methyltransferase At5g51130 isoform X2 [Durio zibethinus]|uniref:RNA methyltransferase n=1 Tax=Durio zibethinus TaxID=66656 RepID=A0A6P5ZR51_DURZI|nr:probable RNA methyltransferase At5g51130 isoform X2 [Durio zibethinus]
MAEENENKRKKMEKPQKKKQKRESEKEEEQESKEAEAKSGVQTQVKNNSNKKRKQVFPFGNYKHYYGYRIGPGREVEEDPRIKVLKKEWFEGKDCLDIGCNSGVVTIQIGLIEDAFWCLRKFVKMESAQKKQASDSNAKAVQEVNRSEQCSTLSSEGTSKSSSHHSSEERDLSDIVSFRRENFVQSHRPLDKYYDTILCLSVTKWIHLNWGDDGLITLFTKIWRLLHPGGIFVLEPQPWESYEKNRKVSETTASNYHSIMFRPEHFQEILLDKIGFRKVEDVTSGLSGTRTGFDRPIFAFYK